jgi:hypothetical protein
VFFHYFLFHANRLIKESMEVEETSLLTFTVLTSDVLVGVRSGRNSAEIELLLAQLQEAHAGKPSNDFPFKHLTDIYHYNSGSGPIPKRNCGVDCTE